MVGGTEAEFNAVKGILECMGQRITHCGHYGMGQAAKLCNNMMLGISMIGVSETMNLAIRYNCELECCYANRHYFMLLILNYVSIDWVWIQKPLAISLIHQLDDVGHQKSTIQFRAFVKMHQPTMNIKAVSQLN